MKREGGRKTKYLTLEDARAANLAHANARYRTNKNTNNGSNVEQIRATSNGYCIKYKKEKITYITDANGVNLEIVG